MIQCAGSRDVNHLAYCSMICCLASHRHAVYLREQYPDMEVDIYYIDIRAHDKMSQFYERVKRDDKINFIRPKEVIKFTRVVQIDDGNGGTPSISNYQTLESNEDNYGNGEFTSIWALKELREKEMIMNMTYDQLHTHAYTGVTGEKETMRGTSELTLQPIAEE
jgi:heterodisulfide reductase subunit A-like polyferredoxin